MLDAKSIILKLTAPIVSLTLLLSTIVGGILKISGSNHPYDRPNVVPHDEPHVVPHDEPHVVPRYVLYTPVGRNSCRIGFVGEIYLRNAIRRVDITGYGKWQICDNLRELCEQFNILRGIYTGFQDALNGWERNAYEYFFTMTNRYDELNFDTQKLMAQCVKIMYDNRNDRTWERVIRNVLNAMSLHGNHCSWRAVEIVNESYRELVNFLRNNHIGFNGSTDDERFLVERVYTELKDDMVEDVRRNLSSYLTSDLNRHESSHNEPLYMLNEVEKEIKYLLCMGRDRGHDDGCWCPVNPSIKAQEYLSMLTCKKYLIKRLDEIVKNSLTVAEMDRLFRNFGNGRIPFEWYCSLSGKSDEEIALLRESIARYPDGEFKDMLNGWAQGRVFLPLDGGAVRVGGVMCPVRKNIQHNRLEAIEGEDGRYSYTDNDGNRHICTIIRRVGRISQVEYVNEVCNGDVQCNIISMLEILSSKARRENNLIKNDGSFIGCSELENLNGFKFLIICFNYGYFEDNNI